MPTVFSEHHQATPPPTKRWTRAECAAIAGLGIWELGQYELVGGELINRMGKNRAHTVVLELIRMWLEAVFGREYVNSETPIDVAPEDHPTNEPEPDIIVLARRSRDYSIQPAAADVRLLVEIADSSLAFDLSRKAELYARAGIEDYWVVDLVNRRVIVHREPSAGGFRDVKVYSRTESIQPLAAPGHAFSISEAL